MWRLCWIIQADSVQSWGPLQEGERRVGVRGEVVTTEGEVRGQRERDLKMPNYCLWGEEGAASWGVQAAPESWRRWEVASALDPPEGIRCCGHLQFRTLASRIIWQWIYAVLSQQICSNLLQQQQETHTHLTLHLWPRFLASPPVHRSQHRPRGSKEPCAAQLLQNELCDQNELEFRHRTNDLGPVGSLVGEVRWDREESVNTRPTRLLVHRGPSYAAPQEACGAETLARPHLPGNLPLPRRHCRKEETPFPNLSKGPRRTSSSPRRQIWLCQKPMRWVSHFLLQVCYLLDKSDNQVTFLMVQQLRLHTPNAGCLIPCHGTRSHMP